MRVRSLRIVAVGAAALIALLAATQSDAPIAQARPPDVVPLAKDGTCASAAGASEAKKHDLRAVWIATVANVDWPSKPGLPTATQQAQLTSWLDMTKRLNLNAVMLQVRPSADTFWPSTLEPWSKYLTGTAGQDPGYDPLAFAVEQAHTRGLALHAWFNPFRVSMNNDVSSLAPNHPARQHPDWVVDYNGKLYYNPGIPEVREFVTNVIMEAVTKYDIDGVHFDDYFYPYPGGGKPFDDADAFARYGQGYASKADWRRANIDAFMKGLHERIRQTRPGVVLGVAPFAVWRNASTDPLGSPTRGGVETYDDLYADTRRWVREGWIDYIAPQIYWSRGHSLADYETLVRWWSAEVDAARAAGHRVGLVIGEATYKAGVDGDKAWSDPAELSRHLQFTASIPQVEGNIYFSAKDVRADRLGSTSRLVRDWYSKPALLPVMAAPTGRAPKRPAAVTRDRRTITMTARNARTAAFAIYQVKGRSVQSCDLATSANLVAIVPRTANTLTWRSPKPAKNATFVVTAIDRSGRESDGLIARRSG